MTNEKQISQEPWMLMLDFLRSHGDSTRKQIAHAIRPSNVRIARAQRLSDALLDELVALGLVRQIGCTIYFRAVL